MPESDRLADIIEAVERLLARGGLEAVTMRAVAAEAGVSLRLVQYYGKSKDALLNSTLDHLASKSVERWRSRSTDGTALAQLRAFFDEALPTDQASRELHRVGVALEALAVTSPDRAQRAYGTHLRGLADHLARSLRSKTSLGATASRLLAIEAMSLAHGLGTLVMAGQVTESEAGGVVRDYLKRVRPRLA